MLVLIDGVPLTKQDSTGSVSLEHIMLDQVERVEIVRGNVSAIYGSGAVGGVIQVFMRKGEGKPRAFGQLEVGSYGSARASAGVSGQTGATSYFVGVGVQKTSGFSAMNVAQYPNENPDADGYRNRNYNLALAHELAKGQTLGLRAEGSTGEFDTDGGGFGAPTDIYKGASQRKSWSIYSHNQITRDWGSKLTFSQARERSVYDATLSAFIFQTQPIAKYLAAATMCRLFGCALLREPMVLQWRKKLLNCCSVATQFHPMINAQFAPLIWPSLQKQWAVCL